MNNLVHEKFNSSDLKLPIEQRNIYTTMFLDYVWSFYNHVDGVYPIDGLTKDMVVKATNKYLNRCLEENNTCNWGDGDSLDRERVRDIILDTNDLGHEDYFSRF